jgi:hypothetical protein
MNTSKFLLLCLVLFVGIQQETPVYSKSEYSNKKGIATFYIDCMNTATFYIGGANTETFYIDEINTKNLPREDIESNHDHHHHDDESSEDDDHNDYIAKDENENHDGGCDCGCNDAITEE